jgi:hypothetical protein
MSGPAGLVVGLMLLCLAGFATVYLAGGLPEGIGRWFGVLTPAEYAKERLFVVDIRDGKVPDDLSLIRVTQGDFVTLKWTTDQPMILHLHGYDIEKQARPGSTVAFAFRAHAAGRFAIEVHPEGEEPPPGQPALVHLEVYPR